MNSGKNIYNAFYVVEQTYANVQKLMDYCKVVAERTNKYKLVTPRFLRYKSDKDFSGWNVKSFILGFQATDKDPMKNGWRNAPIYVIEINLMYEDYNEPMLTVSKFTYDDMLDWTPNCSPASHSVFYEPLYCYEYEKDSEDKEIYRRLFEENEGVAYWGLQKVECKCFPLVEITKENVEEKVFGTFDKLKELK